MIVHMGLIGLLFNLVTYPGLFVNQIVQGVFEELYSIPISRFAVATDFDPDEFKDDPGAIEDQIRELGSEESPGEDEQIEYVVEYDAIESYSNLFGLVLGPFFVTSMLAVLFFTVSVGVELLGLVTRQGNTWLWLLLFYPGFAIGSHAFPNAEPTDALLARSRQTGSLLRVLGYPLVALSKLMSLLRFLWIDAIYAIVLYVLVALPFGLI